MFDSVDDYDPDVLRRRYRQEIKDFWEHRCAYCNVHGAGTLDHVIPRAKGGQSTYRNLILACGDCNRRKGHQDWLVWYLNQPFYCDIRAQKIRRNMGMG